MSVSCRPSEGLRCRNSLSEKNGYTPPSSQGIGAVCQGIEDKCIRHGVTLRGVKVSVHLQLVALCKQVSK